MASDTPATLEQRRAHDAWDAVARARKHQDGGKEYAGEARKLPARIMTSGLGLAVAFILAKAKEKKPNLKQLHEDLTRWIVEKRKIPAAVPKSLCESITKGDADFLRRATDEALAYLVWLNRFAEAEGLTD